MERKQFKSWNEIRCDKRNKSKQYFGSRLDKRSYNTTSL